jgi:DNA helicase-2/ATP-dependent DNA helicase PcrA
MTIHASKGLEFKYVFLPNMVDKKFPTIERKEPILIPKDLIKEIVPEGDIHLQEERRLFYVAVTRAKESLYFSWARDYGGARDKKPSRFLIESGLVKNIRAEKVEQKKDKDILLKQKTKISIEEKHCINISQFFSYSQLSAFSKCPYQYRFAYILKIPSTGKYFFSFGKTMHSTLQKTFELVQTRRSSKQEGLFDEDKKNKNNNPKVSLDEMVDFYEESWIDEWYENEKQKNEYKKKGKDSIKEFYKKYNDNWPKAEMLEKGFHFKITVDNKLYTIRGAIDRVDSVGDGIKIIDYKTGKPKEKLTFAEKEQLLLYQLASSQIFEKQVDSLSFYYFDNNSEVEFLGTEKELEKIQDKIINTIRDINKCEFPSKPGPLCAFCDFKEICEFKKI